MSKVIIGKIVSSFKVDGSFKVSISTSFPNERFKVGNILELEDGSFLSIIDSSIKDDIAIIKSKEINDKETIEKYKGRYLYAEKDDSLLGKNEYYYSDIVGCEVINQDNHVIGKVIKVEEFPAQITLRIKGDKKEDIFIPFIDEFINRVDIANKKIYVTTIGGMI